MIRECQEELEVEQDKWKTNLSLWKGKVMFCASPDGHPLTGHTQLYISIYYWDPGNSWGFWKVLTENLISLYLDYSEHKSWALLLSNIRLQECCSLPVTIMVVSSFDTRQVSGRPYPWGHCFDQIWMFHPGLK